jgi:AcrR family transcriptional regulator
MPFKSCQGVCALADLTRDRIAAAALRVADEHGADGFTMRAVADSLDVTPMALYHHVKDKAALVGLVVDAVIEGQPLPPPSGSWQEDLLEMARWMRTITLIHPAVSRLRSKHRVWTVSIFPMTERWISVWQQSGLGLRDALLAASATSSTIIGFVEQELVLQELVPPDASMLASFPSARMAFGPKRNGSREFELVVRSVIEGVHSRLAQSPQTDLADSPATQRRENRGRRPKAAPTRAAAKPEARRRAKPAGL